MFLESNAPGDAGYIGNELITTELEKEGRFESVEQAVREGYFSLEKALSIYKVTELEYLAYLMLKTNKSTAAKQKQLLQAVISIYLVFQGASKTFDSAGKKALQELELIMKLKL